MSKEQREMSKGKKDKLYSLVPFAEAKDILGIDDRDDDLFRRCLFWTTWAVENFCNRRLVRRRHRQCCFLSRDYIYDLHQYPVRKIHSVYATCDLDVIKGKKLLGEEFLVARSNYYCLPDEGTEDDIPLFLVLRPPLRDSPDEILFRVHYTAGYGSDDMPPDLFYAFLKQVSLNMKQYKKCKGSVAVPFDLPISEKMQLRFQPYRRALI
jgi:hypothetical protein